MATLHSSSESQAQKFIVNSLPQGDYTLSEISTLTPGSSEDPKSSQRRGMFRESVRQKQKASCAFPLASAYEARLINLNSPCSVPGREDWEATNYSPNENRVQSSVFITPTDCTLVDSG